MERRHPVRYEQGGPPESGGTRMRSPRQSSAPLLTGASAGPAAAARAIGAGGLHLAPGEAC